MQSALAVAPQSDIAAASDEPEEAPLFGTAEAAVRFAMLRDGHPGRPLMNRMRDRIGDASDFAGLDGDGQAGMIVGILRWRAGLDELALATLTARAAPHKFPCHCRRPCCSGKAHNLEWRRAIGVLVRCSETAVRELRMRRVDLREAALQKIYTGRGRFNEIANELRLEEETVSRHYTAIATWLLGRDFKNRARTGGLEGLAWRKADEALRNAGLVG